ncbi:hypothetical protein ACIHQR_37550 [Corallococcus coralloides]|uniref:hypothetical protein n=1 Tax=Corallococcus coralloides TaxID=184914 RepID=UPI00384ACFF6
MKSLARLYVLIVLATAPGCGGWEEAPSDPDNDSAAAALQGATCSETDLSHPTVCEGPWEYPTWKTPCYAEAPNPACGFEKKACPNRCRHKNFGIEYYETRPESNPNPNRLIGLNYFTGGTTTKLWQRMNWNGSSCGTRGAPNASAPPNTTASTTNAAYCAALAELDRATSPFQDKSALVVTSNAGTAVACQTSITAPGGVILQNSWYNCAVSIQQPVYNFGTGATECGVDDNNKTCDDEAKPLTCRTQENGDAPRQCGAGDIKGYSSAGISRSALSGVGDYASSSTIAPTCLTADDIKLNADNTGVTQKFDRLKDTLLKIDAGSYAFDTTQLRQLTIGKLELLMELHADALTPEQITFIRGLYTSNPTVGPTCGTRWTPTPMPVRVACRVPQAVGTLVMCNRLVQPHAVAAAAQKNLDACVDAGSLIFDKELCPDRVLLNEYVTTEPTLMSKAFSDLTSTDGAVRKTELQRRLASVQRWYTRVKTGGYTGSGFNQTDLWRDSSAVMNALVLGAYSNSLKAVDPAGPAGTVVSTTQHLNSGFMVDRELLDAAFSDGPATAPPLTRAPVLYLVAKAFQPMSARLNEVDAFHDLGCRFKDCRNGFSSEVSQLHGLLGSMADGAELAVAYNTRSSQVRSDWRAIFSKLSLRYNDVIKSAFLDVDPASTKASVLHAPLALEPIYAFSQVVNASLTKADNFARTGRFHPGNEETTVVGLTQARLVAVGSQVQQARADLDAARSSYVGERNQLLTTQLGYMRGLNDEQNAIAQLNIKGTLIEQLGSELDGYRTAASVEARRYGDMGAAYEKAISRLEQSWGSQFVDRPITGSPFHLEPQTATKWTGATITDNTSIADLAAAGPFLTKEGDVLLFKSEGTWSTTCALQKAANQFAPPLEVPAAARTTSQGYYADYLSGRYRARAHTEDDFSSWSVTNSICASASLSISGASGPFAAMGSVTATTCQTRAHGTNVSDRVSDETEYRTTAVFSSGLRVPTALFPKYPAGALLAVQTVHGRTDPGGIINVTVVEAPATTMLTAFRPVDGIQRVGSFDLYLVVNDVKDPACQTSGDLGGITIHLTQLQPKAQFAKHVQTAMMRTYEQVEQRIKSTIIPQGALLATDIQLIQTEAMANLVEVCSEGQQAPCDLSNYDADLLQLYRTWILQAIAQAERQVLINKLDRQMTVAIMEWEAMKADLVERKRETQLLALLPAWTIRNLDLDFLKYKTSRLVNLVDTVLYPFIKVKYPEALQGQAGTQLSGLKNDAEAQGYFNSLTSGLDWTADWTDIAVAVSKATGAIKDHLDLAQTLLLKGTESAGYTVALTFRKPLDFIPTSRKTPDPFTGLSWVDINYTDLYREASAERAYRVWEAIQQHKPVTFEVLPSDLYQFNRSTDGNGAAIPQYNFQLPCHWTVPTIRGLGVVVVTDANTTTPPFNRLQRIVPAQAAPDLKYVGATGMKSLQSKNLAWTNMAVPVSYSLITQAGDAFWATLPSDNPPVAPARLFAGEGLSPVGSFTLGSVSDWLDPVVMDYEFGVPQPMNNAVAVVLMMNLEFRDKGDAPLWLTNCHLN